jgi:hypothetical protein
MHTYYNDYNIKVFVLTLVYVDITISMTMTLYVYTNYFLNKNGYGTKCTLK